MPILAIEYRTDAERLVLEQAIAVPHGSRPPLTALRRAEDFGQHRGHRHRLRRRQQGREVAGELRLLALAR